MALERLEQAGLTWLYRLHQWQPERVAGRCPGQSGVTVHARGLIPDGLIEIPASYRLPALADVEFVVMGTGTGLRGPDAALALAILANGERLRGGASVAPASSFPV